MRCAVARSCAGATSLAFHFYRHDGGKRLVRDDGEGIAREHLPRLTERFYRVDVRRSREVGGTGLGLAIVKHIVNRHRGRIAIYSKPGEGSSFTVYLPLATVGAGEDSELVRLPPAAKVDNPQV